MIRTADISECGQFRYMLRRVWTTLLPPLVFVMLNPSTADGEVDDHTIRKCCEFARLLGFGGIVVVNLFAYRATKPAALKAAGYPVGPENDAWIRRAVAEMVEMGGSTVVCAWGANARRLARPREVLALLRGLGVKPMALQLTEDGIPNHPLMLPYTCTLLEIPEAA